MPSLLISNYLTAPATTPFIILTSSLQYQEVSRKTTKGNKVYFLLLYSLYKEKQVIAPLAYICKKKNPVIL